ncbi:MAG: long-chain fatty acid--CoA ligase [Bacteroidaceae bacterium]|nr:long-chain fatty acid--CoA ligase [Bacteroidaceae bacterium]
MLNRSHFSTLIEEQAEKYGDTRVMSYRDYDLDKWVEISWNTFAKTKHAVSRALLKANVGVQECVAVFSQNKPECLYIDFGAYAIRAITVPIFATSSAAQVSYIIQDASIRYIFVGEQQQYDTTFSVISICPTLEKIVIFDKKVKKNPNDHLSVYLDEFLAELWDDTTFDAEIKQRQSAACDKDYANILYTSGTTGQSKGVILTHEMYREALRVNNLAVPMHEGYTAINFLPFAHVFERAWSYWCLAEGMHLAVNLRPLDIQKSLTEVHPHCMCSVPRFWEKVYQGVLQKMESGSFVQRKLIKNAIDVGSRCWLEYTSKGKPLPLGLKLKYEFYDRTIIKLLRKTLGLENAHIFPTAGAAVSPEVETFVHAAGINMLVGYGLTESTATVSCDVVGKPFTCGSVGRLVTDLEIKIGENNEILLRGKTITPGYYNKPKETAEAIDAEGWFHTGDAGYMKDGELYLTERIKDLFKTSNGKYIAPQMIESKIALDRFNTQAVIVADQRKFVAALIVPDYALLKKYAEDNNLACITHEELCANPQINQMIKERLDTLQQDLASYEKVKKFVLLPKPFTMETGELTNTLKIKRRVVYDKYADLINKMYEE